MSHGTQWGRKLGTVRKHAAQKRYERQSVPDWGPVPRRASIERKPAMQNWKELGRVLYAWASRPHESRQPTFGRIRCLLAN